MADNRRIGEILIAEGMIDHRANNCVFSLAAKTYLYICMYVPARIRRAVTASEKTWPKLRFSME